MGSRTWHWPGVLLGLLLATAGAQADTLRVATLDWAPYVGPDLPGKASPAASSTKPWPSTGTAPNWCSCPGNVP
ncbi:protein kinase [Pseudomonas aeruginosa]|nr:protein kinase [Pseudomonas aeruginosa]